MFIREKKFKNRDKSYLQIVENKRVDGKVQQNIILSLGCLQSLKKSGDIQRLAKSLLKYCEEESPDIYSTQEERRVHWGIPKIIETLWQLFDFDAILKKCCKDRAIKSDFYSVMELMLSDRFICPCSKLKSYEKQKKYMALETIELHQLYTALDYLEEFKEEIEKELFAKNISLFNMQVDVVFYDVTTFHFESEIKDELRNFGFSKNGKYQEVQVVLGLLVDQEGRPIGYDVFPGNFYEGHTLKQAIEKLQKRFTIEKLIIVADRGMMSSENITAIRDSGYEYIISARLKKLPKPIQEKVLDFQSYSDMPLVNSDDNETFGLLKYKIYNHPEIFSDLQASIQTDQQAQTVYREIRKIKKQVLDVQLRDRLQQFCKEPFTLENCAALLKEIDHYRKQRIILTWSEKRANRDKAKRELLITKAQTFLNNPGEIVSKRGPKKYIKHTLGIISLDIQKVEEDEKWDGFYGIMTNNSNLYYRNILENYHNLWRIEESFRILKSHFQTRPMFHWTPRRIQGHLVLCFISFLFERTIEIELRKKKISCSPMQIREAFNCMQASLIDVTGQKFYLTAQLSELAKEILALLRIKIPAKLVPADQFEREFLTYKNQKNKINKI